MRSLYAVWWWLHPDYMAIAGVVIALLTLGVAYRIARQQTDIARRQAEIAEIQHRFWEVQTSRRAVLSLGYSQRSSSWEGPDGDLNVDRWVLSVENSGTKPARDVTWKVVVPFVSADYSPVLAALPGSVELESDETLDDEFAPYNYMLGRLQVTLYPGQRLNIATATLAVPKGPHREAKLDYCEYALDCEDGRFRKRVSRSSTCVGTGRSRRRTFRPPRRRCRRSAPPARAWGRRPRWSFGPG